MKRKTFVLPPAEIERPAVEASACSEEGLKSISQGAFISWFVLAARRLTIVSLAGNITRNGMFYNSYQADRSYIPSMSP